MGLRPFDPWRSELCTCPPKYSLNPYTGCAHGCIYCYASAYIRDFFRCRPKLGLIPKLRRELSRIPPGSLISLSNTSDPYPPLEEKLQNTHHCLELFRAYGMRVLVVTKSHLVLHDKELLGEMEAAVTLTITSFRHSAKLEPGAPSPERRLEALRELSQAGIPVGLRLDPVFPELTDGEIEEIVEQATRAGAKHLVASTFKPRRDSWKRFAQAFPKVAAQTYEMYFKLGERVGNSWYLPREMRRELMLRVKEASEAHGLTFACCREGFPELHTAESCDGSHLIRPRFDKGPTPPGAPYTSR